MKKSLLKVPKEVKDNLIILGFILFLRETDFFFLIMGAVGVVGLITFPGALAQTGFWATIALYLLVVAVFCGWVMMIIYVLFPAHMIIYKFIRRKGDKK